MAFKNGFRLWDDEYEREHWTTSELAESNARVANIAAIIQAELNGEISHEEALIQHLTLDPNLAEIILDDARAEGDNSKIRKAQKLINEAKRREKQRFSKPRMTLAYK